MTILIIALLLIWGGLAWNAMRKGRTGTCCGDCSKCRGCK